MQENLLKAFQFLFRSTEARAGLQRSHINLNDLSTREGTTIGDREGSGDLDIVGLFKLRKVTGERSPFCMGSTLKLDEIEIAHQRSNTTGPRQMRT